MGKKNRKGKENNANRNSFLKVEIIKDTNPEVETPSQRCASIEAKERSPTINNPLVTKEDEKSETYKIASDYPTIGDLVSSIEKLNILKELEIAFPDIENTLIKAILIASQGLLEPAFNSLLYYSSPEENNDFALPMKSIDVQDLSKIEFPGILQYEILDDMENDVSDQEINTSATIPKIGPEQSSLAGPTEVVNMPTSKREVAESTRNLIMADERNPILSREKSALNGEEKGVNSLKGAAVKSGSRPPLGKSISMIKKKNEPSNNLFDVLDCEEGEDGEEQESENDSGNIEEVRAARVHDNTKRGSAGKLHAEEETTKIRYGGGYKSAFGADSCGLFTADGKDAKQVNSSLENKG
ncbi:Don1p SKDI_04G4860 [Saccharomyces kudriavzevii IFO 1802]|uniref:CUE domain-containing protein n=1 Tax=Saccharomyces kudriavzevii (strain ATCC MYA-4449 / AS 2.2408 / CBS 8840 / NBRC 1802 / NCYC 2889) TaxID=226230 RepID=A0AA35JGE2_SACK1|nr:uncharacterized protein SKDI_04G4860 [Saccharomyces kudriavzevii IFO 1802]CAI4058736.1 hypothetical protein SKDI_04G4860 [Saccharomyces kudriavzevii IFO 1802]